MQALQAMVNPGGTGTPRFVVSARLAPLDPRTPFISRVPSARPFPKKSTSGGMGGGTGPLVAGNCKLVLVLRTCRGTRCTTSLDVRSTNTVTHRRAELNSLAAELDESG